MAKDEPGPVPEVAEDARLTSLQRRLRQAQGDADQAARPDDSGERQARRVLSVLIGYPIGSVLIGWLIGRWIERPWLWVVMLFVGFGLAMREVWKISRQTPGSGR